MIVQWSRAPPVLPSRGPGFTSQPPHGISVPPLTAVPGHLMPPSGLCYHQAHAHSTDAHTCVGKTLLHIK